MCTNDVKALETAACIATSFLSTKGRILANALLYNEASIFPQNPTEGVKGEVDNCIFVELDSGQVEELSLHLKQYKLRAKVKINQVNMSVYASNFPYRNENSIGCLDPRDKSLGYRVINKVIMPVEKIHDNPICRHSLLQLVHGVFDGPELKGRTPLECNLDLLKYISFKKGCYLGQELTARTKFKVTHT